MKDTLRNFLKGYDEVVAAYYKDGDRYTVLFHQDCASSFSITETFTSEELVKASASWDFVEEWRDVSSLKNLFKIRVTDGDPVMLGYFNDVIDKAWLEQRGTED
jgi:hypothetical protein